MPRIRSIKPDFWSDGVICELDLLTRLFYISLWTWADDAGRGRAIARELCGFSFPNDTAVTPARIERALTLLAQKGRIVLYEVQGERYFQIVHWAEHQKISRPTPSKIPPPEGRDSMIPIEPSMIPNARNQESSMESSMEREKERESGSISESRTACAELTDDDFNSLLGEGFQAGEIEAILGKIRLRSSRDPISDPISYIRRSLQRNRLKTSSPSNAGTPGPSLQDLAEETQREINELKRQGLL